MKMLILPLFLILISPYAVAEDLLKARDWTSSDGNKLNATLIETDGKTVKLKRTKDAKTFDLDLSKLSEDDNSLITKAIDQMDEKIENKDFGTPKQIDGKDLDLALRLNKHEQLWQAASDAKLIMIPKRIKRINEKELIVLGDHVAIRFVMSPYRSFSMTGSKFSIHHKSDQKFVNCSGELKQPFSIKISNNNDYLLSLKREDIDLLSILTVNYSTKLF